MKRYIVLVFAAVLASGCASSVITKNFKVITDPSDAVIKVISGTELEERKFKSPAAITAGVPKDPMLASRAILDVRKEQYKPVTLSLRQINDGDVLTIKLEKLLQARIRMAYRLISPAVSQELQFRDATIAVSFSIGAQWFQMRLENVGPRDFKILWEQSEYTDVYKHSHRLMHSGVRYADRNNPIPAQVLLSHGSIQEAVIPVSAVFVSQEKKGYDIKPLFFLESDAALGLKGSVFNLFIPIEINRQIIPYNFKIEITESVRELIKG
jgi:hypothetical protein